MAIFKCSDFLRCPHEIAATFDQRKLIAAHDWCRDESREGMYALYRPNRNDYDRLVFGFSQPDMAFEFKLAFG